ncbi:MAG: response regulator [Thauera aminoaromatica]|mgnify:CR=1 FL=1|uniref:histidine kinase n=2 Tax=Pseudomonadota TaxID=1224 RepID=A0A5C7SLX9_THASP|nr:MAG: response regulator [Thauera aminoaromatica]
MTAMSKPDDDSDPETPRHATLQAALDLIDQGFTLIDRDLRLVAWNRTFLQLLEFPDTLAYRGAPFDGFIRYNAERGEYGEGDIDEVVRQRVQAARAFEPHSFERVRPDGTVIRVRGVPVPGHGFVTVYTDVTSQRNAELAIQQHAAALEVQVAQRTAELERSSAQLRLITDSVPALIAYFDADRRYRYINRGYHEWFGLNPAHPERISAKAYLGAATYAGIKHNVFRALGGESVSFEYDVTTKMGKALVARTTLIPEIRADGTVAGCFELTFDITEQLRAQAMLVQAQKMEALGQLTGGLAHDFNNILTVVLGNLEALRRERRDSGDVAEYVTPAIEAARRGAELIRRLLSFARKQPLVVRETEAGAVVTEVLRLVQRSIPEDRRLTAEGADVAAWALTDPQLLQSSLLNLILNARDATATGGHIALTAAPRELGTEAAARLELEAGTYVAVSVADDGCGMDEATLARVFEPFFTTKGMGSGTGLGMAMVYGFVKQSGGGIEVRSRPGQGTTVTLWLPACDPPDTGDLAAQDQQDAGRGPQGLALLVEDDRQVRQVVRRDLLALGYSVLEAENGSEALAILDRTPSIALVLTDMVMPGGIDGRVVATHARVHCRVPRVALMSGYAADAAPDDWLPVLGKPFTRGQLAAWLDQAASK